MKSICAIAPLFCALWAGANALSAGHANPWAGPDDVVNARFHDANQARSIDTPGEDEMHGHQAGNASDIRSIQGQGTATRLGAAGMGQ
ncbi:hypothetical protein [Cognatishimia sp. F0-27]|uniref:hypothetical protein n=1 Tax=Cognatishimia sp. F0-27 TaxID=2816855 RepID=UPI001D0CA0B2|nr:hypothetical protein [Cognatishimia sp. F0-27]MCC1491905.1 hypothetical protein [Cognatishimia sp. F0-27]